MCDEGRRPLGRLFYCTLMAVIVAYGLESRASGVVPQTGPGTTTVSDTVYLVDGTAASGSLIITWPAFVTANGVAVAGGTTSVNLGPNGALSVALVPNAGATPAGVYYSVVYQLGAGEVRTESWLVPTTSRASLAAVRMTPGSGVASQPVSMQYLNSELATKATDNSVVHLAGTETISGAKTFANSPSVPTPTNSGDIANKSYVDQSVSNVGSGNYLSTSGGTMLGPITLPGNPSAPLQAVPKQYVDAGFYSKADLISGIVPANELGTGTATAGSCLLGNGTWGACGGSGGTGNVSTTPAASQNVIQPAGTQFSSNNLANARYVTTSWNWVQSPADDLSAAGSHTIHLSPCPLGVDTSNNLNAQFAVYISVTGTAEAVPVTGGSCTPGSASGTITVTTAFPHPTGYAVSSASTGIQEAINDSGTQHGAVVLLPASSGSPNYAIYAPVFFNTKKSTLSGYGALVQCFTRAACLINGNYVGTNGSFNTIAGIEFLPGLNVDGVQLSSVSASSGTYTVTTSTNHPFVVGDYVVMFYSNNSMTQEGRFKVVSVPAANQFTYNVGSTTYSAAPSYGWAAIENAAIEDVGDHVTIRDIKLSPGNNQYFHWGIVVGNDQSFKLDGMTNEGSGGVIRCTSNFCGAMLYGRGDQGMSPVINIDHLEASMQCSGNGVRYSSGNTLHVVNSVVQGFNQYGVYYAGGLQNVMVGGTYQESSGACYNPSYPGSIGANAGIITNNDLSYIGDDPIGGQLPSFPAQNSGSQVNNYFVVMHSSAQGTMGPYFIGSCVTTGSGACTTYWPEVNLDGLGTVTYDELRTVGASAIPPNGSGPYAVATGLAGSCSSAGICSNVDAQTGTSTYSVPTATFSPRMNFWPGALILGKGSRVHINDCWQVSAIVTTFYLPSVYCNHLIPGGNSGTNTPFWAVAKEGDSVGNNNPSVGAVLKQAGPATGAASSGLTGLYGFLNTAALGQTDILTFAYSNPFLTLATPGYRPAASANDTAAGFDSPSVSAASAAQLAFRAPVAISEYIGSVFDNASYKERLTAVGKTFNVPVTINGNLTVNGTCTGCGGGGGNMTWPSSAGIAVYTGSSAWGASIAAPTSPLVGVSDTQTLTNKTVDGVSPTTLSYLDATSSIQAQLNSKAPSASPTFTGSMTLLPLASGGSQCLHVNASGVVSGTGSDCGSGGGGGSGTVNSGNAGQVALYGATGTTVSGDSLLTDNGTTVTYSGAGGISASGGTFSGNVTVGGQLILTGSWLIDTPISTSAMTAATSGTSSLGVSNDGNFYISANAGTPNQVATTNLIPGAAASAPAMDGTASAGSSGSYARADHVHPSDSSRVATSTTINGHALSSNVTLSASDLTTGTLPHAQLPALVSGDIPNNAANTTGSAASLSAVSALPNGTTTTTQGAGDGSAKLATDAFVTQTAGLFSNPFIPFPVYMGLNQSTFPAAGSAKVIGFLVPVAVTTSKVVYYVGLTADNTSNTYEIGVYNAAGTLVLHYQAAGTSFAPTATTVTRQSWSEGTVTLPPGKYYEAITTSCSSSCATFTASPSETISFYSNGAMSVTSNTLATSITAPGSGYESFGASPLTILME